MFWPLAFSSLVFFCFDAANAVDPETDDSFGTVFLNKDQDGVECIKGIFSRHGFSESDFLLFTKLPELKADIDAINACTDMLCESNKTEALCVKIQRMRVRAQKFHARIVEILRDVLVVEYVEDGKTGVDSAIPLDDWKPIQAAIDGAKVPGDPLKFMTESAESFAAKFEGVAELRPMQRVIGEVIASYRTDAPEPPVRPIDKITVRVHAPTPIAEAAPARAGLSVGDSTIVETGQSRELDIGSAGDFSRAETARLSTGGLLGRTSQDEFGRAVDFFIRISEVLGNVTSDVKFSTDGTGDGIRVTPAEFAEIQRRVNQLADMQRGKDPLEFMKQRFNGQVGRLFGDGSELSRYVRENISRISAAYTGNAALPAINPRPPILIVDVAPPAPPRPALTLATAAQANVAPNPDNSWQYARRIMSMLGKVIAAPNVRFFGKGEKKTIPGDAIRLNFSEYILFNKSVESFFNTMESKNSRAFLEEDFANLFPRLSGSAKDKIFAGFCGQINAVFTGYGQDRLPAATPIPPIFVEDTSAQLIGFIKNGDTEIDRARHMNARFIKDCLNEIFIILEEDGKKDTTVYTNLKTKSEEMVSIAVQFSGMNLDALEREMKASISNTKDDDSIKSSLTRITHELASNIIETSQLSKKLNKVAGEFNRYFEQYATECRSREAKATKAKGGEIARYAAHIRMWTLRLLMHCLGETDCQRIIGTGDTKAKASGTSGGAVQRKPHPTDVLFKPWHEITAGDWANIY